MSRPRRRRAASDAEESSGSPPPSSGSSAASTDSAGRMKEDQRHGRCPIRRSARKGDVVTVNFTLTPENGFVPHPLFDTSSGDSVSFVLGWGNYLPGLHDLVEGMTPGEGATGVSIDAGYGRHDPSLVVAVSKSRLAGTRAMNLKVGDELKLGGGMMKATVVKETDDEFFVDANPPLAGSSYSCDVRLLDVDEAPGEMLLAGEEGDGSSGGIGERRRGEPSGEEKKDEDSEVDGSCGRDDYDVDDYDVECDDTLPSSSSSSSRFRAATFAVGCFWGGELAYMRERGVAGTRVGYTRGAVRSPTYRQVCEGATGHREAILVVYDPDVVTYERLVDVALERMEIDAPPSGSGGKKGKGDAVEGGHETDDGGDDDDGDVLYRLFADPEDEEEERNVQYKHGVYVHSEEQREAAESALLSRYGEERGKRRRERKVEVRSASTFYPAEEYHQSYLLKGGQSARKGCREPIRCYG